MGLRVVFDPHLQFRPLKSQDAQLTSIEGGCQRHLRRGEQAFHQVEKQRYIRQPNNMRMKTRIYFRYTSSSRLPTRRRHESLSWLGGYR
ncbi:hypothetical protein C5688_19920 [Methylocystis sp. MitZ-2018]|nr:hypothetical protein C5688_19920 [Methylocystis sp. MitZ-2018]